MQLNWNVLTIVTEKGSKKKGSLAGDEDSESAASVSTLSSLADIGFDESASIEDDPFEASIDALYEKRQACRTRLLARQPQQELTLKKYLCLVFAEQQLVREVCLTWSASSLLLSTTRKHLSGICISPQPHDLLSCSCDWPP